MSAARRPSEEEEVAKYAAQALVGLLNRSASIDLKRSYFVQDICAMFVPTRVSGVNEECLEKAFSDKKFRKCITNILPVDWNEKHNSKGRGTGRTYGMRFTMTPVAIVDETALKERLLQALTPAASPPHKKQKTTAAAATEDEEDKEEQQQLEEEENKNYIYYLEALSKKAKKVRALRSL